MKNLVQSVLAALVLCGGPVLGQQPDPCPRPLDEKAAAVLPQMAALAAQAAKRVCSAARDDKKDMGPVVLEFLEAADRELKAIGVSEDLFPFAAQIVQARSTVADTGDIANMKNLSAGRVGVWFYDQVAVTDPAKCDQAVNAASKSRVAASGCEEMFRAYIILYSHAQNAMQWRTAEKPLRYIGRMRQEWDDFLTESRSQTPLELWLNTWAWGRGESKGGKFLEPPRMQWVLLHPSVVIERVGQAPDGSHTKEGVLLELAGANWWRPIHWAIPTGGSVVAVYSERAGVPGWGGGLAVYYGKYTFGATSHGGNKGFFVSVDLLELAKNKESMLQTYTKGALPR